MHLQDKGKGSISGNQSLAKTHEKILKKRVICEADNIQNITPSHSRGSASRKAFKVEKEG